VSLEESLQQHEESIDGLLKFIAKYTSAVKGWKKACQIGHVGNLQKAAALADELCRNLPQQTCDAKATWAFDVRGYLESDEWIGELQEVASSRCGLRTIQDNDTLISSPVTVRSQPSRGSVSLGRVNWPAIRPRVVAEELKRLRDKTLAANSSEFLESLFGASAHLNDGTDSFAKFRDIYDLFCLTPGYKKDNPPAAFAQQIYALQRSDQRATRAGRRLEFEYPSGNVKERDIFTVIAEDGRPVRYYGIWFK
jgi:hypothetical protein